MPLRIAVGSDERTALTDALVAALQDRGARVDLYGALSEGDDPNWPVVAHRVARQVADGDAAQGILLCWSGTGVSMAANKVAGARAALCADAETATGARRWNDANILCLSLRLTRPEEVAEILDAWFSASPEASEQANIQRLKAFDLERVAGTV